MATAAKAKLLLRELKTIKADLAFAKQRCSQLEEENKTLRDNREKGVNYPAPDDDLVFPQIPFHSHVETDLLHLLSRSPVDQVHVNYFLQSIILLVF